MLKAQEEDIVNIWGKVLGTLFGFMFGKFVGAALGFFVGHMFDKGYSQDFNRAGGFGRFFGNAEDVQSQAIFFHSLFSVMGHIAKADGQVTQAEINIASALMDQMNLQGGVRREAQQAFREGKEADFPLQQRLDEFVQSCHGRRDILQVFLEILIQSSYADGRLDVAEKDLLEKVARQLGFKQHEFLYLLSAHEAELRFRRAGWGAGANNNQRNSQSNRQQSLQDAYRILGVKPSDDDKAIKKAYRRLMSQHHPDKLVSKGLPKEALELAKNKAQDIQAAYEMVKQQKGF